MKSSFSFGQIPLFGQKQTQVEICGGVIQGKLESLEQGFFGAITLAQTSMNHGNGYRGRVDSG